MKKTTLNFGLCAMVLMLFLSLYHPPLFCDEDASNLDRLIQQRNQEKRLLTNKRLATLNQIDITEKRTAQVLQALKVLNSNIDRSQKKLERLKVYIFKIKKEILETGLRIGKLEREIARDKREINQKLRALYTLGRVRDMTLFIGLNSFEYYFRNKKLLQYSTRVDIELLSRLNQNLDSVLLEKKNLEKYRAEFDVLKQEEEDLHKLLRFERQQQATYLRHLKKDRTAHVRYLREIQVELEKLNDNLYSLAVKKENNEKTKKFNGFYNLRNRLPSPVSGKLVHRFGNRQSSFYTLFRRGVLVETKPEAPVHCILAGKVVWAGPFRGYQNLVILDHGKGSFSVYGNLGELYVLVNDVLEQGYILGNVGRHNLEERFLFYFEMRYNKRAINPNRWLTRPQWKRH